MASNQQFRRSIISPVENDRSSYNRNWNYHKSIVKSTIGPNEINNEEFIDVDNSPLETSSFEAKRLEEIDADAALAFKLQTEELSKNNTSSPYYPYSFSKQESEDENSLSTFVDIDDQQVANDAILAARLQEEENQKQQQRHQTRNRIFQPQRPEIAPIPTAARSTFLDYSSNRNNNHDNIDFSSFLRLLVTQIQTTYDSHNSQDLSSSRRNLQNTEEDFGPEHYDTLLQLDEQIEKKALTNDQINTLPTEKFHRSANKSDEEKKCGVCWDDFEQNDTLRRLRCFHLYHKSCIDPWLERNNQCPVCRMPSIE